MKLTHALYAPIFGATILSACGAPAPSAPAASQASLQSATPVEPAAAACDDWLQWGQGPTHEGHTCSLGQPAAQLLDDLVYDPFVAAESAENDGLITHYQTPLIAGDDLYMEQKSGQYLACDPPGSGTPAGCGMPATWALEIWNEVHYTIARNGKLTRRWSFESDWKPEPFGGFEPVFHAALAGERLYVPGAGGTVFALDRRSGKTLARINPFGATVDPSIYVSGPISADRHGNIYYTALQTVVQPPQPTDGRGWLIKVSAHGEVSRVLYTTLVPDAPAASDQCSVGYDPSIYPAPYPPLNADGTVKPPSTYRCGSQRPSINVAPTIAPDGTIYVVSHAHFNPYYGYLVAVRPDLTPRWAASLRDRVHDGCGVLVPEDGDVNPQHCTPGAPIGIDPYFGDTPAMGADDSSSSSPVVLPDGSVLYGGLSYYNDFRGHLLKFSRDGAFLSSFDFGWDVTPAVVTHDGTYSIITKDNHYTFDAAGNDTGPYYLTRLSPTLQPEWQFLSTNTQSCQRDAQGKVTCVEDHPFGFEWCINAPAVDRAGNLYANSEDGNLYVIDKDGHEKSHFFLNLALGAAYTPLAIDRRGHLFVLNGGHLSVVGQPAGHDDDDDARR